MTERELIDLAKKTMNNAYVPYSGFSVGAALKAKSGKIYTGVNIESASFGATICAERTALFKAISEGETEFEALAVVSSSDDVTYPCGICRQVLSEHMKDGVLYFEDRDGNIVKHSMDELLPYQFDSSSVNRAEQA